MNSIQRKLKTTAATMPPVAQDQVNELSNQPRVRAEIQRKGLNQEGTEARNKAIAIHLSQIQEAKIRILLANHQQAPRTELCNQQQAPRKTDRTKEPNRLRRDQRTPSKSQNKT